MHHVKDHVRYEAPQVETYGTLQDLTRVDAMFGLSAGDHGGMSSLSAPSPSDGGTPTTNPDAPPNSQTHAIAPTSAGQSPPPSGGVEGQTMSGGAPGADAPASGGGAPTMGGDAPGTGGDSPAPGGDGPGNAGAAPDATAGASPQDVAGGSLPFTGMAAGAVAAAGGALSAAGVALRRLTTRR